MSEEQKDGPEEQVAEHDPHYDPIISLPLMQVSSGEEGEEILLKLRSKLLRLDKSQAQAEWKERGVGEMKVLRDRQSQRTRLLMRRDKTLTICCNHFFHPQMKLQPNVGSDKSWIWGARDFADGEMKDEILCIKFTTPAFAQQFKTVFEKCARGERVDALPDEPAAPAPAATATAPAAETAPAPEAAPAPAPAPAAPVPAPTEPAVAPAH